MAKMGEGDPRWLVSEIGNTNPGSWHWEAKSVLSSCQEQLTALLDDASLAADIPEGEGSVKITRVKSITGEAHMTTRKGGKKFPVYDLVLTLDWEGSLPSSEATISGEFKVEELASGSEEDDYVCTATVVGTGTAQEECRRIAASLRPKVVAVLSKFVADLHES